MQMFSLALENTPSVVPEMAQLCRKLSHVAPCFSPGLRQVITTVRSVGGFVKASKGDWEELGLAIMRWNNAIRLVQNPVLTRDVMLDSQASNN